MAEPGGNRFLGTGFALRETAGAVFLSMLVLTTLLCSNETVNAIYIKRTVFFCLSPFLLVLVLAGSSRLDFRVWVKRGFPAILFALWAWASLIWAGRKVPSFSYAAEVSLMVGAGLATASLASTTRFVGKVLKVVFFLAAATAVYAFLQYFEYDDEVSRYLGLEPLNWKQSEANDQTWRVSSFLGNPTFFAGFLVSTLPPLLGFLLVCKSRVARISVGVVVLLGVSAGFPARSRAGLIALFSAFVFFGLTVLLWGNIFSRKHRRVALVSFCLLISAGTIVTVCGLAFSDAFKAKILNQASGQSTQSRKYAYIGTSKMIKDGFYLGHGGGNFGSLFPYYRPVEITAIEPPSSRIYDRAHSEYLQIASELGVVGALLFLWAILIPCFSVWRFVKNTKGPLEGVRRVKTLILFGLLAGFFGMLIQNSVSVDLRRISPQLLFWSTWGMIVGLTSERTLPRTDRKGAFGLIRPGSAVVGIILVSAISPLWAKPYLSQSYAMRASSARDIETSVGLYDQALKYDGTQPRIIYFAGNAYFAFARVLEDEAKQQLELMKRTGNPFKKDSSVDDLPFMKRWKDMTEKALSTFKRAETLHGPLGDFILNQGVCLMTLGRLDEAVAEFSRAADLDRYYAKPYDYLGRCYMLKAREALDRKDEEQYERENKEARRCYELAREYYPQTVTNDSANGGLRLAYAYFLKMYANSFAKQAEKIQFLQVALSEAEEAVRLDPERSNATALIQDIKERLSYSPGAEEEQE